MNKGTDMRSEKEKRKNMIEKIGEAVNEAIGAEYTVQIKKKTSNNGVEHQVIGIAKIGENIETRIHIDDILGYIASGDLELEEAVENIVDTYEVNRTAGIQLNSFGFMGGIVDGRKKILENVVYQPVNKALNIDLLKNVPWKEFLDLAVLYRVRVRSDERLNGTILVTREMCDHLYGISEEELDAAARKNGEKEGFQVMTMGSAIKELMDGSITPVVDDFPMYVLLNDRKDNVGIMCFTEYFRELADLLNSDLYILPSSIYELMAVPESHFEELELQQIVSEINNSVVNEEEFLSNSIYKYTRENDRIEIAQKGTLRGGKPIRNEMGYETTIVGTEGM